MQRVRLLIPLFCFVFVLCDSVTNAQRPGRPGTGRSGSGQPARGQGSSAGRPGMGGGQQDSQQPPWIAIFDTDGNGELSALEIKNATASLLNLDRNRDGRIADDEFRLGGAGRPANMGQQRGTGARPGEASGSERGQLGGRRPSGRGRPEGGGAAGEGGGRGGDPSKADAAFAAQVMTLDENKDGSITLAELPEHMHEAFEIADADNNDKLSKSEILVLASQFRRNKLNPDGGEPVNAPTQGQPRGQGSRDRSSRGRGSRIMGSGQRRGQAGPGVQQGRGQQGSGGQVVRGGQGSRPRDWVRARDTAFLEKFEEGSTLPDSLKLYNVDQKLVAASSIFEADYTVIVGGCLTCPEYRNSYPEIEAVAADYRDKGVQFYFLFQSLTHPENWGYVQPTSIQERFAQVQHARELLQTKIPWLTDTMDNEMKQHFGMTPNSQFVFDQDGKIVHRDSWGRGSSLRESLATLVGASKKVTTVDDLNLPEFGRHKTSPADMLFERKTVDGVAIPLRVAAAGKDLSAQDLLSKDFGQSHRYAKLRPEADQQLLATGTGQLYLGFLQDPVLGAAWNNLADPPKYRIIADGVTVTPQLDEAPIPDVDSDTEPREFIVDVSNWEADSPITIQLQYFGCNKAKGWCKAVEQKFTVWLEQDRTAGMVNGRSHFPGGGSGARPGSGQHGGSGGQQSGSGRPSGNRRPRGQ